MVLMHQCKAMHVKIMRMAMIRLNNVITSGKLKDTLHDSSNS
jgi:hypothetical protein